MPGAGNHESNPNVAMLLTPRARDGTGAAIAVVRLRGARTADFLQRFFSKPAVPQRPVHGTLHSGEEEIDDPVVVLSSDREWADLNLHGGAWVIHEALELARREGFAIFENLGLPIPQMALSEIHSVLDREVVAHLPLARTEMGIRALLGQPWAWATALRATPAVSAILNDRSLWLLLHPPQVVLVGEPNVGKSTLANALFGRDRSITADVPGTTRDWVGEIANIDGLAVMLVDTPGIRQTADPLEQAAIAMSAGKIQESDLAIRVLDATRLPLGEFETGGGGLVVVNKTDCPAAWDFESIGAIPISAKTGTGIDLLRERIKTYFGLTGEWKSRPCWWTLRQREILLRALATPEALEELA
ncbi:MAG: 50S ribosome-binding GTPase [Planctomycetota bacterium]|nr:50S ribosome-binding GTPase [Planctomycetota bacterium]